MIVHLQKVKSQENASSKKKKKKEEKEIAMAEAVV